MLKKWFGKKDDPDQQAQERPTAGDSAEGVTDEEGLRQESPQHEETGASQTRKRFSFLRAGFQKTRAGLKSLFGLKGKLDEDLLEQIEADLYSADFGPGMVQNLLDGENGLRAAWKGGEIQDQEEVLDFLKCHLKALLRDKNTDLGKAAEPPAIYLIAGVNGTGKTTSIAKLANRLLGEGHSVLLAAADTFRAAAVEQLTIWSQRLGIEIVTGKPKADPASVAYAGLQKAREQGVDYLIIDTAGRLHTDKNLMRELKKIRNVVSKNHAGAPHESLLVLDSTNGQNAIQQSEAFKREIEVTGIILTKLDGTAKGGVVFAIHDRLDIPVKLVGVGEKIDDLAAFNPDGFVDALFEVS